ncbi:hypothetical protein [Streptomyces sp. NPDC012616]|uniref:hypothetical protein n=1 Tax=Streptomyces sp. NPDC012616 TaxID=3364840 RepID=UPI0036DFAA9A
MARVRRDEGDLRITGLMRNSGLPEAGDAVLTLPPRYLAGAVVRAEEPSAYGKFGMCGRPDVYRA